MYHVPMMCYVLVCCQIPSFLLQSDHTMGKSRSNILWSVCISAFHLGAKYLPYLCIECLYSCNHTITHLAQPCTEWQWLGHWQKLTIVIRWPSQPLVAWYVVLNSSHKAICKLWKNRYLFFFCSIKMVKFILVQYFKLFNSFNNESI